MVSSKNQSVPAVPLLWYGERPSGNMLPVVTAPGSTLAYHIILLVFSY